MSSPPSTQYPSSPSSVPVKVQVVVVNTSTVTLVDNESKRYEVKAYLLMAWSAVFGDMFEGPLTTSEIPINADTETVNHFLTIVQEAPWLPRLDICKKLFDLCDQYDCKHLRTVIFDRLGEALDRTEVQNDPWSVFCLASQHHKSTIALRALGNMEHSTIVKTGYGGDSHLVSILYGQGHAAQISAPYLGGLIDAAMKSSYQPIVWSNVAAKFEPMWGTTSSR